MCKNYYRFVLHHWYNQEKQEHGYGLYAIDNKGYIKKTFLKHKRTMNEEIFTQRRFRLEEASQYKVKKYINKNYPELAFAIENGIWLCSILYYDGKFNLEEINE